MQAGSNRIVIDEIPLDSQQDAWRAALNSIFLEPGLPLKGGISSGEFFLRELPNGSRMTLLRSNRQTLTCQEGVQGGEGRLLALFSASVGPMAFQCCGLSQALVEAQVLVTDLRSPWSLNIDSEFELFILEVSRDRLFGRIGTRNLDLPVTIAAGAISNLATALVRSLSERIDALQQAELAAAEAALVELLVDGLLSCRTIEVHQATHTRAGHLHRVHAAIEAHLSDSDLSIGKISAREGLSARYVQKLFERENVTFSAYLRKRRLERCRQDLADPNQSCATISEIGFRWGFRDQATFSRAFSLEFGVPPRDLRKSAVRIRSESF